MKPHILLTLAALLATACSGPAPQPAADAPPAAAPSSTPTPTGISAVSCDDFKATIAGLENRFASAGGGTWDYDFLDGGDHDWDSTAFSKIRMTNADLCTITTWGVDTGVDFACRWRQPDEAAANAAAQALVDTLQACLPGLKAKEDASAGSRFKRSFELREEDPDGSVAVFTHTMRWPSGGFPEIVFGGAKELDAWIERRNALASEASQMPTPYVVTYTLHAWEKPCDSVDRLISNAVDYGKLYGVEPDEFDSTSIAAIDPCMKNWTRRELPIGEPLSETFPDDKGVPMTVTHPYIKAVEYTGLLKGKPTRLRAYESDTLWVWLDITPN